MFKQETGLQQAYIEVLKFGNDTIFLKYRLFTQIIIVNKLSTNMNYIYNINNLYNIYNIYTS